MTCCGTNNQNNKGGGKNNEFQKANDGVAKSVFMWSLVALIAVTLLLWLI